MNSSSNFENLGELEILPLNVDNDVPIHSFVCLDTKPNCLAVLLQNGIIHHCVIIPNKRGSISLENIDQINVSILIIIFSNFDY